jgi:hypothetical protein
MHTLSRTQQWRAVKQVRLLAMRVYEKHFDAASGAYYWYNPRLKTSHWGKPRTLAGYDIDPPDEWIAMAAAYDLLYYYNPRTFVMVHSVSYSVLCTLHCCYSHVHLQHHVR